MRVSNFVQFKALHASMLLLQDGDLGTWDEGENAWATEISEDLSWEAQEAIKVRFAMATEPSRSMWPWKRECTRL